MTLCRPTTVLALAVATLSLAACISDDTPPAGAAGTAQPATSTSDAAADVPPLQGGDRTVGDYDAGEMDARLSALVTPELLARAQQDLDEAPVYGRSGPPPSLLSHLPEDDGNGNALAAEVRDGCDGSAPLRWNKGALSVTASRGTVPGLVVSGPFMMNVRFGETVVSAGQDWTFTVSATPDGWRVSDVEQVMANVNWAPALSG